MMNLFKYHRRRPSAKSHTGLGSWCCCFTQIIGSSIFLSVLFASHHYYELSLLRDCTTITTHEFGIGDAVPRSPQEARAGWKLERSSISTTTRNDDDDEQLYSDTIIRGDELPGYTGWARPASTLVQYFRRRKALSSSSSSIIVPQSTPLITSVTCQGHELCEDGGALFYLRAYGPALLSGTVHDYQNGTYTFTIVPHDVGQYRLEAVLTFSHPPPFDKLPVPFQGQNPENAYEGYMLPGFPIEFQVTGANNHPSSVSHGGSAPPSAQHPKCRARDFIETSNDSPLVKARWVLQQKQRLQPRNNVSKLMHFEHKENITSWGYQTGENSVGFSMDYQYINCTIDTFQDLVDQIRWNHTFASSKRHISGKGKQRLHILLFGDSNIRNQYNYIRDYVAGPTNYMNGKMALTYVEVMKFWPNTWSNSSRKFLEVYEKNPDDHYVVVYNLGLHEITNRCSLWGQKAGRIPARSNPGPCIIPYREDVATMTDLVLSKPAMVRLWQSTTAGWPKWGVFGVPWSQKVGQFFPLATDTCNYMNQAARQIMVDKGVEVMDTYWMTLSRPDHRESQEKDTLRTSYKLVHMGPEVYFLLVRQILTVALEALLEGVPEKQYL